MKHQCDGLAVLVTVFGLFFCATSSLGALTVSMYKTDDGPRSVGSWVTVKSKILDGHGSVSVEMFVNNKTAADGPGNRVGYTVYLWDVPAYDQPISTEFPHLHFNTSIGNNLTREITWYFTNLPSDYNGLILTTRAEITGFDPASNETTLYVKACAESLESSETFNCSMDPCGYECVCHFNCSKGFINDNLDPSSKYGCTAAAEWSPAPPICVPEPTTTETATTPTVPTTSKGSTTDTTTTESSGPNTTGAIAYYVTSGPALAGIGGVLAAVSIGLIVFVAIQSIDILNKIILYVGLGLCLCVWAVSLGLTFGLPSDESAVIAGIVLGSLALAGMLVVGVFLIMQIISHNRKGIKGKPDESGL